jgi:transcription initiation factor TFIID subunit 5
MSAATPAASSSGGVSPVNASAPDVTQSVSSIDRLVLEYLRTRGHKDAERALNESLESGSVDESGKTVSAEDLIKTLAVYAQKPSRPGDNVLKESANVLQELTAMGNPPSIQNLIASLGTVGAEEILSVDPTDKEEGFRELEAWVEGSLDMYKVLQEHPSAIDVC